VPSLERTFPLYRQTINIGVSALLLRLAAKGTCTSQNFNYFVDQSPSGAQGGKGVVVPGCPACRNRINTMGKFLEKAVSDRR
jgi:hypothetical protein